MACPHCGSWSVKADRSLAGRMVCGRCGRPLSGQAAGRAMCSGRSGGGGARPPWWARPGWGWLVLLVVLSAALATLAPAPDRSGPPRRQPASSSGWR